jgi:hypothetical protein
MSASVYKDIRAALVTRLQTLSSGVDFDIAWEGVKYTPSIQKAYIKPAVLWGEGEQAEIGQSGRDWEIGIFQLTIVSPGRLGNSSSLDLAGSIKDHFKRGTVLSFGSETVTIRKVYLGPAIDETSLPISIAFYCLTTN